jgi:hypothetical protein
MESAQGTYSLPLKSGAPIKSSARMHPIDQTSTIQDSAGCLCKKCLLYLLAVLYFLQVSVRNSRDESALRYFSPVCKHNFGSPVPSGCNIFRQVRSILIWYSIKTPAQTKITNFKFAVRVHEEISRLEVPVYDSSRMDKLHPFESNQLSVRVSGNYRTSKNLVAKILDMLIRECLARTDDLMEIG